LIVLPRAAVIEVDDELHEILDAFDEPAARGPSHPGTLRRGNDAVVVQGLSRNGAGEKHGDGELHFHDAGPAPLVAMKGFVGGRGRVVDGLCRAVEPGSYFAAQLVDVSQLGAFLQPVRASRQSPGQLLKTWDEIQYKPVADVRGELQFLA
jgi:hypothetical protein